MKKYFWGGFFVLYPTYDKKLDIITEELEGPKLGKVSKMYI